MSDYYGPAGGLSTDDPTADANQIATDRGPWEEWEDEGEILGEFADGLPGQVKLYGCCPECIWWDSTFYWEGDLSGLESAMQRLDERHKTECPDCKGVLEFDREED